MNHGSKYSSGFSLMELMVTLAIAAVVLGIAIPNFSELITSSRLTTSANQLVAALNLARSEAVKRGMSVTVRPVDNASFTKKSAGANWEDGWDVFTDNGVNNGNGTFDVGDELIRTYEGLPVSYTLRDNNIANFIRYDRNGLSNQSGSFIICNNSDGNNLPEANTARLIIVNFIGRVRMGSDDNNNGIPDNNNVDINTCTP